jgi:arylsulfatase A-like enzyme
MAGPGVPKGKRNSGMCYLLDIYPTLCELAGLPAPKTVEGRSLVPVLRGRSAGVRDSIFAAYRDVQRCARTDRWKWNVYHVNGRRTQQLFDIRNDPWEMRDLASDPRQASRRQEMQTLLNKWMAEVDDPTPREMWSA